ncbi:MAG: hypothetical protein WA364_14740, partial [Candidatus Nitrosopolaris sp.]
MSNNATDFQAKSRNHYQAKIYGDYTLEAGWGTQGHNVLTICYAGGCENNTLITISPTSIKFKDNNHNIIHLVKILSSITPIAVSPPKVITPPKLNGTWNITSNGAVNKTLGQIRIVSNNEFTGTFNGNKE